ncbi:hypothetical protein [Intrasporangium mesophilum]
MEISSFDRVWRGSGLAFVITFVVSYLIYGGQPHVNASAAELAQFYNGDRTRVLVATALLGFAMLNLLWFAAALASGLRDAGQGIWAAAATASSAVAAAVILLWITINGALAYSVAAAGNDALTSALNGMGRVSLVVASFPMAMLIMAGTFGLWQAQQVSTGAFTAGVAAVVLVLLGGFTWAFDGVWSPDGLYSRLVVPVVALLWVAVVSAFLYAQSPTSAPTTQPAIPLPSPRTLEKENVQ